MSLVIYSWVALNAIAEVVVLAATAEGYFYFDAGRYTNFVVVHEESSVNWFGAIILALLYTIALPLIAVQYWIYWLFTVGR